MRWISPLAVALFCVGCSGPEDLDEASLGGKGRFGLVYVNYDHDWAERGEAVLFTTTAQFVRYAAMAEDQVARLLALPLDPAKDLPAVDQCRTYDLSLELLAEEAVENEETGSIELLEAGNLRIQTDAQTVTLAPRHFPWLLPFISGVIYGEAQNGVVERVAGVKATAEGGEAVGAFAAQLDSPELPRLLQVAQGQPSPLVVASRSQPLAVRWSPAGAETGRNEVTYLELRYNKGKRDLALRCQLKDDGAFEVPASHLAGLVGKVPLEIARLKRAFFSASGLQRGELRVTVRDTAALQLQ